MPILNIIIIGCFNSLIFEDMLNFDFKLVVMTPDTVRHSLESNSKILSTGPQDSNFLVYGPI